MPFINAEHRQNPDQNEPGDRCFIQYRSIKQLWNQSPRWRTVDLLASEIWPDQTKRALVLAFLVFFHLVVMPYEIKKLSENGDIE